MATSGGKRKALGSLGQWWGVLAGALLIAAWINGTAGPAVVIALSAAALLWSFFQAPVPCGASVRVSGQTDGCRNNGKGLLLGCHIHQHRLQKLQMLIIRRQLRRFCAGLFSTGPTTIVTLAGIGSFLSGLVALVPGVAIK